MRSPFFPKRYADTVQRLRVPSGFLLAIAFAWLAAPRWTTLLAGLPVCAAGLALRAWAAGHLR
ncbi:MAG TPA: protein-S-isoprenylcysteine methyltransferase, partial [Solibacterales bacterium]|nr:protein-S-isoprenylcysteine methyltransferase [Bryobacterales bacterium]